MPFDFSEFVGVSDNNNASENAVQYESQNQRNSLTVPQKFGILNIRTANAWLSDAARTPVAKMLFGPLWFEGELCLMFADMNVGKSLLATQIGDALADGKSIGSMAVETQAQPVLYVDTELNGKQFETRYSVREGDYNVNHYRFSDNLHRAEIRCSNDDPVSSGSFEDYLLECIEHAISENGYRIVIVDNLSYLGNETDKSHEALSLMKRLKTLKEKHKLSILVLGHTKKRCQWLPLNENDLAGSKMLMNLCDSSIAIGNSGQSPERRYIKQMKERNVEKVYGEHSVLCCNIAKRENCVQFEFLGQEPERNHLQQADDMSDAKRQAALELTSQGLPRREVASLLGISPSRVQQIVKNNSGS